MMTNMIVLGIDPGTHNVGYACVRFGPGYRHLERMGALTVPDFDLEEEMDPRDRRLERARRVANAVNAKISVAGSVHVLVLEDCMIRFNLKHLAAMAAVNGALASRIAADNVVLLDPHSIKKCFGAKGKGKDKPREKVASKLDVETLLRPHYHDADAHLEKVPKPLRNHAWDALASVEACVLLRAEWFVDCDPWAGKPALAAAG